MITHGDGGDDMEHIPLSSVAMYPVRIIWLMVRRVEYR
jgi:hypothetical protein